MCEAVRTQTPEKNVEKPGGKGQAAAWTQACLTLPASHLWPPGPHIPWTHRSYTVSSLAFDRWTCLGNPWLIKLWNVFIAPESSLKPLPQESSAPLPQGSHSSAFYRHVSVQSGLDDCRNRITGTHSLGLASFTQRDVLFMTFIQSLLFTAEYESTACKRHSYWCILLMGIWAISTFCY